MPASEGWYKGLVSMIFVLFCLSVARLSFLSASFLLSTLFIAFVPII